MAKSVVKSSYSLSESVDRQISDELETKPITKDTLLFWLNNLRAIQTTLDLLEVEIQNILNSR